MVYKTTLYLAIMVQVSIQASGLNIDQLHQEVFPYNSRNTDSKRQYVYGRILSPSKKTKEVDQNSRPSFEMNSLFSSAMGNKLKRLVSNIDKKMQDENSEHKMSNDKVGGNLLMMKKKGGPENQQRARQDFGHNIQIDPSEKKRFLGLNEDGLQKVTLRSDDNAQILNEDQSVNGPRTVWMGNEDGLYRVPHGVERRQGSKQAKIFRQHGGLTDNMKKPYEPFWYDRQSAHKGSTNGDNVEPQTEEIKKKDAETVEDFQFFNDEDGVMKQIKRVFDDDTDEETYKKDAKSDKDRTKSEEQRKIDEKHEELMDEYIKYIAQATSIKKRSPVPIRDEEQWYEMSQAEDINERLKEIERIMLDEANDIMREETGLMNPNEIEAEVMNRVRASNDLDNIRNSILDLQDIMYDIRDEDMQPNDVYVEQKRGNKLGNALNIMAPSQRLRRVDEDLSYNIEDDCPDEELYNRDCSLLTNFLPDGEYKKYFRSACSAHQLCYICMDVYGTTASECDSGFLEESYRICEKNKPCRTATKTMVLSNHRKRRTVGNEMDNCEVKLCLKNKIDVKRSAEK